MASWPARLPWSDIAVRCRAKTSTRSVLWTVALLVGVGCGAGLVLEHVAAGQIEVRSPIDPVLTPIAAASAGIAAIVLSAAAGPDEDVTGLRLASGLLVYGVIVIPLGATEFEKIGEVWALAGLLCFAAAVGIFAVALIRRGSPSDAWPAAATLVAASMFAAGCGGLWPALIPPGHLHTTCVRVLVGVWVLVGLLLVVRGVREGSGLLYCTGVGVVLIGAAHAVHLAGSGDAEPFLALCWLRLIGLLVVLGGVTPYALRTLAAQRDRAIADAESEVRRVAEREAAEARHELRNVLVGLSGAAHLIARGMADAEIGAAMRAEIDRLRHLVDGPASSTVVDRVAGYPVLPVLHSLVLLHRTGGADIELDVPANLQACGSGLDLSQAVVNLLVNCSRHAPGSPIRVRARSVDGFVRIEVADQGPGGPTAVGPGYGIGLSISRQLLWAQGGDLWLEQAGSGCTAVVTVPELGSLPVAPVVIPAQAGCAPGSVAVEVA